MKLGAKLLLFFGIVTFFSFNYLNEFFNSKQNLELVKKIEAKKEIRPLVSFAYGIKNAVSDNVKNIWTSFLYPIESLLRVFSVIKNLSYYFVRFVINPQPDHVYCQIIDSKIEKVCVFFNRMTLDEKSKWCGYVISDFIIGYVAPFGIGWKAIALTRNTILSVKSFKYLHSLNRISNFDPQVIKIIDSTNGASLMNVKYSFEYMDQFRQYLNDIARHD